MGALGSMLVAAMGRRLSVKVLRKTVRATTRITAMVLFILICAQVFSLGFRGLQGEKLVQDAFTLIPGGINASIWFLMLLIFLSGFLSSGLRFLTPRCRYSCRSLSAPIAFAMFKRCLVIACCSKGQYKKRIACELGMTAFGA